jgi:hypothetical protein
MERLAATTVWISRPATWYSTCSAPASLDPHSPYQHALGHISLFPPSLARPPIPLFLATYTGYMAAYYRAANRSKLNGSMPLQRLTLSSRVLGASFGLHLPV